jgi:hypothetical protein
MKEERTDSQHGRDEGERGAAPSVGISNRESPSEEERERQKFPPLPAEPAPPEPGEPRPAPSTRKVDGAPGRED